MYKTTGRIPNLLQNIHQAPEKLYYRGDVDLLNKTCISVVGTRKNSDYGRFVTERIVEELACLEIVIVSGLASGIDTIAHRTALKFNIPTIAVLGSGIENIYPKENQKLALEIEKRGLIISEYPDDRSPTKKSFPTRNRIISGLSIATIVTEAPEHSGALHTAWLALNENREVFAVPGDIDRENSAGTNKLIKDSRAHPITCAQDVIKELSIQPRLFPIKNSKNIPANQVKPQPATQKARIDFKLSLEEAQILDSISARRSTPLTDIVSKTSHPIQTTLAILSALEIRGIIENRGGKYLRTC